jgi:DNA-binding transcriptional ArsR family regulator
MKTGFQIDRVLHEPARLNLMKILARVDTADFVFLQRMTELTKGNLSAHMRKLSEAKYVSVEKRFGESYPITEYRITSEGSTALNDYIEQLQALLLS